MIQGDIKKMSFSYAKCPAGDLHTGEIMSLVCVDAKCSKRGLICPICRMNNHDDHEVMPLKIFIGEVQKLFLQSEDAQSLNNLADYLRSIDNSRKQLLNILRDTAENIAKQLKTVEQKINENYTLIRKNILAQSTMSTKLPIFLQNLLKKQDNDPYWLQQQFQRYGELIKFEKSVMQISDKAKKIVEDYSQLPKQIKDVLAQQTEKLKSGFKDLFAEKSKVAKKSEGYTFSPQNKYSSLSLSDDKKQIYGPPTVSQFGMGYVSSDQSSEVNRKITFKIKSISASIVVGMGMPKKDKQLAFIYSMPIQDQHFTMNSDGYCENQPYDEAQENSIQENNLFYFNEVGSEVVVSLEGDKNQIVFTNKKTGRSKSLKLNNLSDANKKDLQFFVAIGDNDRVAIIDN